MSDLAESGGLPPKGAAGPGGVAAIGARWRDATQRYPNMRAIVTVWAIFLFIFGAGGLLGWVTSMNQLETALVLAVFTAVVAFGQNIVVLSGGIDLSIPFTMTATGVILTELASGSGELGSWAIVVALGFATAVGLWNGIWIAYLKVSPLIATLATDIIISGLVLWFAQGTLTGATPAPLPDLLNGSVGPISNVIVIGVIFVVLASLLLLRTSFGRRIYAIGNSQEVAYLSGIRTRAVTVGIYALASFNYGLAALLICGWNRQASFMLGDPYLFPSIAAVVLGGTSILGGRGNFVGTAGGAALFTGIGTILAGTTVTPAARNVIIGVVLLGAVALIQRERVTG